MNHWVVSFSFSYDQGNLESEIADIVLSHFKCYEMGGFGGTIKNLAMGGAPVFGKKEQHVTKIIVDQDKCIGCQMCSSVCPEQSITVSDMKASPGWDVEKSRSKWQSL